MFIDVQCSNRKLSPLSHKLIDHLVHYFFDQMVSIIDPVSVCDLFVCVYKQVHISKSFTETQYKVSSVRQVGCDTTA